MVRGSGQRARLAEGWIMEGRDARGGPVRLRFAENELAEADLGLTVGRHPEVCHRVIDDPSVSRRHFRVLLRNGQLCVEDLNSLNGTLVGERLLAPFEAQEVAPGQSVVLGQVALGIRELDE